VNKNCKHYQILDGNFFLLACLERLQRRGDSESIFLDCTLRYSGQSHSQQRDSNSNSLDCDATVADDQMSKISSVLKSLVREWSEDGKIERDMAYGPLKILIKKYPPIQSAISRIAVPGGGTGRLAFDLAALG